MTESASKLKKKIVQAVLKEQEILGDNDTGQIIIHLNNGAIAKISKNVDVLK